VCIGAGRRVCSVGSMGSVGNVSSVGTNSIRLFLCCVLLCISYHNILLIEMTECIVCCIDAYECMCVGWVGVFIDSLHLFKYCQQLCFLYHIIHYTISKN